MKTKSIKKEENFDAVKTMREIRDQLSKEIMNMTFAEEKAYLRKLLAKKTAKRKAVEDSEKPTARSH
ncbi:MAG TPA: hypothetical protein VFF29_05315 [Bacteroidota bacterium]|nr:hypothetical protein [Bacteroidota bacterium]